MTTYFIIIQVLRLFYKSFLLHKKAAERPASHSTTLQLADPIGFEPTISAFGLSSKYEEKQKKIDEINESARAFELYMEDKLNELKRTHPGYVYNYYDYLNEPEYKRIVSKKRAEITELEKRINLVSLDDSYKAKGEVIQMKKKLSEKQEELDKIHERHAYALDVDSINEQLKEYREKVRQAIREVENS